MRSLFKFMKWIIIIGILGALCYVGFYFVFPDVSKLKTENPGKTSFMEYREREWKAKGKRVRVQRKWVPLRAISPYLVKAVTITEDDKFWTHKGFDIDAMQKAFEKDMKAGRWKAGGSTISQQLVKNLYLTPEKSFLRKFKEAIITWRMERAVPKRRILEIYLNVVEWGEGVFGAEAAAQRHFGKPAAALNPMEAATLAVVLPSPRRYRTDGSSRYVERRTRIVYEIMVRRGIVVEEFEDVMGKEAGNNGMLPESPQKEPESPGAPANDVPAGSDRHNR